MNSIFPFLFFAVLSGYLSGCHSGRSSFLHSHPTEKRLSSSIPFRNFERYTSKATSFQPLDDDVLQQLDGGELEKRQSGKEISTKNRPSCAKSKVYCTYDAEYDDAVKEQFEMAMNNSGMNDKVLGMMTKLMNDPIKPLSSTRFKSNFLDDPVCPSRVELIFPQRGINQEDEWVFILNQDNLEQGVKTETCLNVSGLARFKSQNSEKMKCGVRSQDGSESVCLQKFVYQNMITMDKSGTNITTEAILIPSCCACMKRKKITSFIKFRSPASSSINNDVRNHRRYGLSDLENFRRRTN